MENPGFEARLAAVDVQREWIERQGAVLDRFRALHKKDPDRTVVRTVVLGDVAWTSFQKERDARTPETPPTAEELQKARKLQEDLARTHERVRRAALAVCRPKKILYESGPKKRQRQETDKSNEAQAVWKEALPGHERELRVFQRIQKRLLRRWDGTASAVQFFIMTEAGGPKCGKVSVPVWQWH